MLSEVEFPVGALRIEYAQPDDAQEFAPGGMVAPANMALSHRRASSGARRTTVLENGNHRLEFNLATGGLASFRATPTPDQEFVPGGTQSPAFVIQYLDGNHAFRRISS